MPVPSHTSPVGQVPPQSPGPVTPHGCCEEELELPKEETELLSEELELPREETELLKEEKISECRDEELDPVSTQQQPRGSLPPSHPKVFGLHPSPAVAHCVCRAQTVPEGQAGGAELASLVTLLP